jgi:Mrr N-terminal domain
METREVHGKVGESPKVLLPHRSQLAEVILMVLSQAKTPMKSTQLDLEVINYLKLSEDQKSVMRSQNRTQISYDLAWTRTSLKAQGLIHQPISRHWSLV